MLEHPEVTNLSSYSSCCSDSSCFRSCLGTVETTSRLAQCRFGNLASRACCLSDPFKMNKWDWYFFVERNRRKLTIMLFPESSSITRDNTPVASFIIQVIFSVSDRKVLVHPEVVDKKFKNHEYFVWVIEDPLPGRFIVDLEFLDLKTGSPNDGGELCSIWAEGLTKKEAANATALTSLSRMFTESIHTDIVINTSDGSIGTHRAVLSARSPVFRSMFSHDFKEKELSTIDICDMSIEACKAFLGYIYGSIQTEEFFIHRLALLRAADKYDILDLKEACQDSLMEDIDTNNVLERLQNATLYELPKLKNSCLRYLVKFGKIFDMRDSLIHFCNVQTENLLLKSSMKFLVPGKASDVLPNPQYSIPLSFFFC